MQLLPYQLWIEPDWWQLYLLNLLELGIIASGETLFSAVRILMVLLETRNQVAVEVICCLFNFNERSPVSLSILVLNYFSTKYKWFSIITFFSLRMKISEPFLNRPFPYN